MKIKLEQWNKDGKLRNLIFAVDISASKKCGICVYDADEMTIIEWGSINYFDLIEQIRSAYNDLIMSHENITILFENSNLTKGNFHGITSGQNVGKHKRDCFHFKTWMEKIGINHVEIKPNGYSQYFKDRQSFIQTTGIVKVPNSDVRAAIAMIYKNYRILITK